VIAAVLSFADADGMALGLIARLGRVFSVAGEAIDYSGLQRPVNDHE
jgi:hypothetical protein